MFLKSINYNAILQIFTPKIPIQPLLDHGTLLKIYNMLGAIGGIIGGLGTLFGSINQASIAHKNRKMSNSIHPEQAYYNANPLAQTNLNEALNFRNGRMAGAGALQNNILNNQANATAGVTRNATDGSQSLAILAGLQGNSNNAFSELQTKEAMNKQYQDQVVMQARQGVINESDKVYQDQVRRYNSDQANKNALLGLAQQNGQGAIADFANFGLLAGNGAFGNFGFGSGGGRGQIGVPMMGTNSGAPTVGGLPPR